MKPNDKVPLVFECCRIVRGYSRSIICDLQRFTYRFLPNDMEEILKKYAKASLEEIKSIYNNQFDDVIQENFDLLEKEEFIFYTSNPEWFPAMSLDWDEPLILTNAIIDVNPQKLFDFEKIWLQLSDLECEHIQMRIYKKINISKLEEIINQIGSKRIISLEIITEYDYEVQEQDLISLIVRQPRITSLILHNAPENKLIYRAEEKNSEVFFITDTITDSSHCGKVSMAFFSLHINSFTESHHYNSCLNRKISIDVDGNIKNCPSMSQSFGNVWTTRLQEALAHPDFKKYWNITKNQINVCKECEFRYICTDCRAYLEKPEDIYSKPLKCGYNPYTNKWEEWSTNPLKQQAIDYYNMRETLPEFKIKF